MQGRKFCDSCETFYLDQHQDKCHKCSAPEWAATLIPFNPIDWIYDLECYPNIFTCYLIHAQTGHRVLFEISDRRNDLIPLFEFLMALKSTGCRMIGFNNIGYDYPLLHYIITNIHLNPSYEDIYNRSDSIINTPWMRRYDNVIWDSEVQIPQIDLMKVHHFDNENRRTSLKELEFNMNMDNIEDLPYPPGTFLNHAQKDELIRYNGHDDDATLLFYSRSIEMIEFREQLSQRYGRNFINFSDKKIGTEIFVTELEKVQPGSCYSYETGRRQPRQTLRDSIKLADVIFPYIKYTEPEFERIRLWLMSQVITETKGVFTDLKATVKGMEYSVGMGGLHSSIDSTIVKSDDDGIITDWDVAGFYPEVGTANGMFPAHLSEQFCVVNGQLKVERSKHKKGTALNNGIKLARNGAFGDSNSKFSPFFDSQYTMGITINGQLLLLLLVEQLNTIPGLQMIQANTDGVTVKCPHNQVERMNVLCKWWEDFTCLELETAIYKRMFIRDVNSYIAEYSDGKLKSKGAYVHKTQWSQGSDWTPNDMDWHQNFSSRVVAMAAEEYLVHGHCYEDFICNHTDLNDFMLRAKVGRSDRLELNVKSVITQLTRIQRYYVSTTGGAMTKISPPPKGYKVGQWKRSNSLTDQFYKSVLCELADPANQKHTDDFDTMGLAWDERINTKSRSVYKERRTNFHAGYLCKPCNNMIHASRADINFQYYIDEVKKLVEPLL